MEHHDLFEVASDQLDRVLGFFPRVDAKASVVLAVNTGMLAFLAAKVPPLDMLAWWEIAAPILTILLLGISLWHLYKVSFPNLAGGHMSLVYFSEIALRTEAKFIEEFKKQSESDLANEFLAQVWRNSQILKEKFHSQKLAFVFLATAIPPWVISLVLFTLKTATLKRTP